METLEKTIGMGDYIVDHNPHVLSTYNLGSCVAVALYDSTKKIGALAHVMLPSKEMGRAGNENRFADVVIKKMFYELLSMGAKRENIVAKIAGGAHMFPTMGKSIMNMGDKNIEAVMRELMELHIRIKSKDVGKTYGRSVFFDLKTGIVTIKSIHGIKKI